MRQHRILLPFVAAITALTGACGNDSENHAASSVEPASAVLSEGEYC